jgi:hypothetical protein
MKIVSKPFQGMKGLSNTHTSRFVSSNQQSNTGLPVLQSGTFLHVSPPHPESDLEKSDNTKIEQVAVHGPMCAASAGSSGWAGVPTRLLGPPVAKLLERNYHAVRVTARYYVLVRRLALQS